MMVGIGYKPLACLQRQTIGIAKPGYDLYKLSTVIEGEQLVLVCIYHRQLFACVIPGQPYTAVQFDLTVEKRAASAFPVTAIQAFAAR